MTIQIKRLRRGKAMGFVYMTHWTDFFDRNKFRKNPKNRRLLKKQYSKRQRRYLRELG